MESRTKYNVKADYQRAEYEFIGTVLRSIACFIAMILFVVLFSYTNEIGFLALIAILLLLVVVGFLLIPAQWKKRSALKQELSAFDERELKFTISESGLDADEWHFGVGRKKKEKREEADEDEEYFDDSDSFNEVIDEE